MQLQSDSQNAEMKFTEEKVFDGHAPYGFRRGSSAESANQSARSIEIMREGGGFKAVISEGDERFSQVVPFRFPEIARF
jgi:hypothetical protein